MSMRDVLGLILGGGQGSRLYPLTKLRAKPAVPLGGKYRLIDIPISLCINAGIPKIYVLTQFLSGSLHNHISQTYKFDVFSAAFVRILAAEETRAGMDWYEGTADAVRKQLWRLANARAEDVLILSGDHLYRMDYREFVGLHREQRADVTIAVQPVGTEAASRFGILRKDGEGRITSFHEKPAPEELHGLESAPGADKPYMASMGVYLFRADVLNRVLEETDAEDFGKEIIPAAIESSRVYAYEFHGYWEDIGTIRAFYEANLALTLPDPPFDLYDVEHPIYTRPRFLPPAVIDGCDLEQSVVADGCLIHGSDIRQSVIGLRSVVGREARIIRSVMMGADFFETPERRSENRTEGRPDVGVGRGSSIEGAIIDKNARIGEGVTIRAHDPEGEMVETEDYVIRDGIVVIPKNAVIPDGTVI
jgi:glucose-1-phosphate adenylyltransferase